MKTFDNLADMDLKTFVVRQFVGSNPFDMTEAEYEIRAEGYSKEAIGDSELIYSFFIGEDEIASVFSPHYVCDKRPVSYTHLTLPTTPYV